MADINNDGFLDMYVCRSAFHDSQKRKNLLYINNKDLTFTESAEKFGIADTGYSTQAAFFDFDRDGDLDLYVANHPIDFSRPMDIKLRDTEKQFLHTDKLYRNNGNETFTDVTKEAGILNDAFALGLVISDVNGDGWPDIYVSNDYIEPDNLYINNKNAP